AREERFALSKDALKMKGTLRRPVISLRRPATGCVSSALSMTQGPAMRNSGRPMPISCPASLMRIQAQGCAPPPRFMLRARGLRQERSPLGARGTDEAREERMAVARRGGELRMELRGHEPGMAGDLDDF